MIVIVIVCTWRMEVPDELLGGATMWMRAWTVKERVEEEGGMGVVGRGEMGGALTSWPRERLGREDWL